MRLSFKAGCWLCLAVLLSASCAHAPVRQADGNTPTIGGKAALTAVSMIGRPYKYKGNTPAGFDCSGLVQYSYLAAGLDVPHGTKALKAITLPIDETMQTGDLLFFNERGKTYSHVGIYLGGDTFVHAPGTRGKVKTESLEDPHWKSSFAEARRFMEPPEVPR